MQIYLNNRTILDFLSRWDANAQPAVINDLLLIAINVVLQRLKNHCVSRDEAGIFIQKIKNEQDGQSTEQPQPQIQQQLSELKQEIHKINIKLNRLSAQPDHRETNKSRPKSSVTPKVTEVHPVLNRNLDFRLTKHHLDDRQLKEALTYNEIDSKKNKTVTDCRPSQKSGIVKMITENITTYIPSENTAQKHKSNEKQTPKHLRKIESRIKDLVSRDRQGTSASKVFKKMKSHQSGNPETAKRLDDQLSFKNTKTGPERSRKLKTQQRLENHLAKHDESNSVSDFSAFQMSYSEANNFNQSYDSRGQHKEVGKISRRSRQSNIKIGEEQ